MTTKRKVPLPVDPKVAGMFPTTIDLPPDVYSGIGKVVSAHAILENAVSEVVYELMNIDYPEGRTAFSYRAASVQMTLIRKLLDLRESNSN